MKCHACEYFVSPDHCWADTNTVNPCPKERTCDQFEYEASYGEIAQLEREKERARCLEIVKKVCSAAVGSESTRAGVYLPEILAEEIERQIRGEK